MPTWSIYRRPVEHYEVNDVPDPGIDPVAKVFRLLAIFIALQALNLGATIVLFLR